MLKKKILFIIDDMKIGGGAQRCVALLSEKLSIKYEVYVLTLLKYEKIYSVNCKLISLRENLDIKIKLLNFFKVYWILRLFKLSKIIQTISPDLIISFRDYTNLMTILTKIIFKIKVPLIISIRDYPKMAYKQIGIFKTILDIIYRSKQIDKIITVSKEIELILKKNLNIIGKKISTIYNGIDLDEINLLKREKIKENVDLFDDNSYLIYINIGRLKKQKGHKFLIKAYSIVKKEVQNSKLLILGEGPLRNDLNRLVNEYKLTGDVLFLGKKKNVYKYLYNSDIFVLSSIYEGLPNVILEALACELPVISTNCPTGPREILKKNKYGILVKTGNYFDLAQKMILLAKEKKLKEEYKKQAITRIEYFNINKIIKKWFNIIESCL